MVNLEFDRTRALRGAVSGAVAAAVWAFQQPLDKLLFGSGFDDVEFLGKAVARDENWYPIGLAMHMGNGAAFGALYASIAPSLPLPAAARGVAVALIEHTAAWPLGAISDRIHPARDELPTLSGNRRVFAQELWRHVLFGLILGELERRLNDEPEPAPPDEAADYSSNGHGQLDHAVGVTTHGPAEH